MSLFADIVENYFTSSLLSKCTTYPQTIAALNVAINEKIYWRTNYMHNIIFIHLEKNTILCFFQECRSMNTVLREKNNVLCKSGYILHVTTYKSNLKCKTITRVLYKLIEKNLN